MLFEAPEPVPRPRRRRNDIRSLLLFGAAVAVFFGLLSFVSGNQTIAAPTPVPIQTEVFEPIRLQVSREANDLRLTWDPEHPAVMTARRACLFITDGAQSEEVELLLPEFRKGELLYEPAGTDVTFRLEVVSARGAMAASYNVRVLGNPPPVAAAPSKSLPPESSASEPAAVSPLPVAAADRSEEVARAAEGVKDAPNSVQNVPK